ncbi:MAG: type I 3-dehydroquinate dehydratase [Verrucomicrobia bacterium]|nr:type I 3-dehydroquinate dehydratase [Verrucomicrobiota bacterium]MCH8510652.1 type I 3-dehydroquinate dehydratase [Kiritimatiellia bacterium]
MTDLTLGTLSLSIPRVVGTVLSLDTFGSLAAESSAAEGCVGCDIVEARLDAASVSDIGLWMEASKHVVASGTPVLATLRLPADGGKWADTDVSRKDLLERALNELSAIDVEVESPLMPDLCAMATALQKPVVVSHHNFERTPSVNELCDLVESILECPFAIPKIATMVANSHDLNVLSRVLNTYAEKRPICILGMGPLGLRTRVCFPGFGSKLTYGYLDSLSAPGQLPSARLVELLREILPEYK